MTAVEPGTARRTAAYLYGVVAGGRLDGHAFETRSIDARHPARLIAVGDLAAIVSDISIDEFDEEALPERLNDLDWLDEKARAHESVLECALRRTAVVPFRFCTIYRSEEDLRAFVSERRDELCRVLDYVEGRVEVGVKGYVRRAVLERSLEGGVAREDGREDTGRAYLRRRQEDRRLAEEFTRRLSECAAAASARLERLAVAAASLPVRRPGEDAEAEAVVLNGAYLVPAEDDSLAREAGALTAEYAPLGIRFEVTGPWPPYNFVPGDVVLP